MVAQNEGNVLQSPYVVQDTDINGNSIRITITFNNTTRAITACSVFRDSACLWKRVMIGVGVDGAPDSSDKIFNIPSGTTAVSVATLANRGLSTIQNVLDLQITFGP